MAVWLMANKRQSKLVATAGSVKTFECEFTHTKATKLHNENEHFLYPSDGKSRAEWCLSKHLSKAQNLTF